MTARRSFVALELEPQVVAALLGAGETLRKLAPTWRDEKWVAENNLHVTLKFLGTVKSGVLEALQSDLDGTLSRTHAFTMPLRGLRAIPSHGRRSMVWATLDDSEGRCARLAEQIDDAAAVHGIERDAKRFTPHVTLVRARKPRRLDAEALSSSNLVVAQRRASMSVLSATLFASTLTRTGPVYDRVATWRFMPDK